ncbi:MAG: pyridoxine 5'-phosphate synthase [Candidatus Omnitrophica bacterium]|nr:pyridoxine 5'-phosphate synthase [Candidatus Omnitrophota bacterium]
MARLGVNVDHVATLRQARRGEDPSPILAALTAEQAGCDGIVCHLREDRRHIQDRDLAAFKEILRTPLNLEMAIDPEIVRIACRLKPAQATLVPERRRELTTEGGLDLRRGRARFSRAICRLKDAGIRVSLFVDPDPSQVERAAELGVPMVELHTGRYAQARSRSHIAEALSGLEEAARLASGAGLRVAAGHGLDYRNVSRVVEIREIEEFNIGFSIVARAIEVGFHQAVREMARLVRGEP